MNVNKFEIPKNYTRCPSNIWTEFSELIIKHNPLNLGMGFPDYSPPKFVTNTLSEVVSSKNFLIHQYTRDFGHPRLVLAFSKFYSKLLNRKMDHMNEVLTMATGCQALYTTIMAYVEKDDEVIIIEPYFDFYENIVNVAGGKCKFIPLRLNSKDSETTSHSSSEWSLDKNELQHIFNERTKLFILNTPNNPLGKVFKLEELTIIADLCKKWNVVCIADEVYEFFIHEPNKHIRMATLPDMWERTITICCPGKTFGVAGWELGIAYGPEELIYNLKIVHQNLVYTSTTPIQEAYALLFEKEFINLGQSNSMLQSLPQEVKAKRDFIVEALIKAGFKPVIPEGGFLIIADCSPAASLLDFNVNDGKPEDYKLAKWMIENLKLAGIPLSAFYSQQNKHLSGNYIRFCFLKSEATLQRFADILNNCTNEMLNKV